MSTIKTLRIDCFFFKPKILLLSKNFIKLQVCDDPQALMFRNNQSCIRLMKSPILHAHTKHI